MCQKPFCSDRKNGTHCLLTCESALMAKVCEIIVNRDYIRENNAARILRFRHYCLSRGESVRIYASTSTHIVFTHVSPFSTSPSPSPSLSLSPSLSCVYSSLPSRYAYVVNVYRRVGVDIGANTSGSRTRVKKKARARASVSPSCCRAGRT